MNSNKMKAIVWTKYGSPDVLQLKEVDKPTPKDNEVLIRIYATTVSAGDCELRRFQLPLLFWLPVRIIMGIRKPKKGRILGQELSGEIESVGKAVTQFKVGDQVVAPTTMKFGGYAEYICLQSTHVMTTKPVNMSFEEAATIPTGGLNALYFLRKGNIQSGQKVLIYGAAGSIGTYAVQIAKYFGAEVTGVDSTGKLDMLRAIGANHVIDYTREDFTKNGKTYDVIIDIVGKSSFSRSVKSLKQYGAYILGNPSLSSMIRGSWISMTTGKSVINALASYKTEDLIYLKELIDARRIKSVIDKRYPLEQIPDAHRYVEKGYKMGNVVITIEENR